MTEQPAARSSRIASTPEKPGHMQVEDGEIRLQVQDGADRLFAIGALRQDLHAVGGAQGRQSLPYDGMIVRENHGGLLLLFRH